MVVDFVFEGCGWVRLSWVGVKFVGDVGGMVYRMLFFFVVGYFGFV